MDDQIFRTVAELELGLEDIRRAPRDEGELVLLVRRPQVDEREVLAEGELDLVAGLVGDNWRDRTSSRTPDGAPHPDLQLNVMSARMVALLAPRERWPLAGDQLFLDLDLSAENLPAGTRVAIGDDAVIEVTPQPHTGCAKFVARYGLDAMRFVNSPLGRQLRLRGLAARVVRAGRVRAGDRVRRVGSS